MVGAYYNWGEFNVRFKEIQVNKCKRNKNEKYKNELRYFDK